MKVGRIALHKEVIIADDLIPYDVAVVWMRGLCDLENEAEV